ncbi:MAG: glycoside hydrolase family 88 protein [Clostridia bacterium]|nr:glycoside hydrolase family 88 protein [Clostridia bacterium]MBQ6794990.1 glycoside hydrolase family 88 protein [Clostridia bacterium]
MNKLLKSAVSLVIALAMVMSVVSSFAITAGAAEDKGAIMPTYEGTIKALEAANDYYQTVVKHNQVEYGIPNYFWAKAAYLTGNMEAYYATGIEAYRKYATDWANSCGWSSAPSTNKNEWKWGYDQSFNSKHVLFGDFQICFQSYIDLYNIEKNESKGAVADQRKIARALEVMSEEVSRSNDDFWWWADSLYMVMPVMTKLYQVTQDEKYLDGLYRFWKYAKELMYDGPGGIPTHAGGYTTSAKLANGARYSDPNNYTYLFFRDAGYVFPLKPNPGHEGEKNFWARGDGWVFAGLAKVLQDMPDDYEHYDEFLNTYLEMAPAIRDCMRTDENGYGFWTQSMLQGYPTSASNPNGYETSGTAFFTYGFAWGINAGILPKDEYLETAVRAWNYLENIALQPDGMVGYVQYIGSNATKAMGPRDNQNFGVGAYLLAAAEMSRLVGHTQKGDNYPYLQKKMQTYLALRVNTPHYYKDGKIGHIDENDHSVEVFLTNDLNGNSTSMMPARLVVESFGGQVQWNEAARTVTATLGDRTVIFTVDTNVIKVNGVDTLAPANTVIVGGRTFVPLRALAESLGKKVYWNQGDHPSNGLIVIGHKANPFYAESDAGLVEMLRTMLGKPETYPTRPKQPEKAFVLKVPTLSDANRIQADTIEASEEPEGDHGPYNASDGRTDENSRYVGNSQGCNISFTYKEPVDVGQVALVFWKTAQRTTKFKLEYTADGTNWKQVYNGSTTMGKAKEVFDINTKVKAFRIFGYGNSEGSNWFSLIEFEVYKPGVKAGDAVSTTITDSTTPSSATSNKATGTKVNVNASAVTFSQQPEANNPGRNAFDGNAGTVWASNGPAEAVIDLGKKIPVSEVGVQFKMYEDDRTIPYSVEISDNRSAWTSVFNGSSKALSGDMLYAAVGKEARYVKVKVEGNTVSGWSSVAEIAVYTGDAKAAEGAGTTTTTTTTATTGNKANGTKVNVNANNVTFSQQPEANNPGRNAFDGNTASVWASNGPAEAVIDLGKATKVSSVGVQFMLYGDDRTIPFSVSVSNDKSSWTTVYTGSSVAFSGDMIFVNADVDAKYVKVNVEGNNISGWSSVAELAVYSK